MNKLTMYSKINPSTKETDYYFALFSKQNSQTKRYYGLGIECTFRKGDFRLNIIKYYDDYEDEGVILSTTYYDNKEDAIKVFYTMCECPEIIVFASEIL